MRLTGAIRAAAAGVLSVLALSAGAAFGSTRPASSSSMPYVVIKYSCPCSSAPPMAPETAAMYRLANEVSQLTKGAVNIEVFPNSSLVPQASEFEDVQKNVIQMNLSSGDEYQSEAPAGMIYQIPYLFTSYSQELKVFNSKYGQALVAMLDKKLGVHILGIQDLGARELDLNTTNHISTPADMHGIKLRMPPGTYWTALGQALGGAVTPIAFDEIYLSLQTGVIQAQDNPLPTDIADKFYEVTKQIVLTNHVIEPIAPTISDTAWNEMSPAEQNDLVKAVAQTDTWESEQVANQQVKDIKFLKHAGLKVYSPDIPAFRAPALKTFLCNGSYVNPLKQIPGLLNYALSVSGAKLPTC